MYFLINFFNGGRGTQRQKHLGPMRVQMQPSHRSRLPDGFKLHLTFFPYGQSIISLKGTPGLCGLLLLPGITNIPKMLALQGGKLWGQIVSQGCSS